MNILSESFTRAINIILDYNWEDELEHFLEEPMDGHVFTELIRLKALLDPTQQLTIDKELANALIEAGLEEHVFVGNDIDGFYPVGAEDEDWTANGNEIQYWAL